MIGATYRSKAAQAVLGPAHSDLIPAVLWSGWLNAAGTLIAMTGLSVDHAEFGPTAGGGVTNLVLLDCGVAGVGWSIAAVGLFDAATGGDLIVSADLTEVATPAEDDVLAFGWGMLVFQVA